MKRPAGGGGGWSGVTKDRRANPLPCLSTPRLAVSCGFGSIFDRAPGGYESINEGLLFGRQFVLCHNADSARLVSLGQLTECHSHSRSVGKEVA